MLKTATAAGFLVLHFLLGVCMGVSTGGRDFFAGQDLHLTGARMVINADSERSGEQVLVFDGGFSMSIGANQFSSNGAVVWLRTERQAYLGKVHLDYRAQVYLEGDVSVTRGAGSRTTDLSEEVLRSGEAMVGKFLVSGEVFATAELQERMSSSEFEALELYGWGLDAISPAAGKPRVSREAAVADVDMAVEAVKKDKQAEVREALLEEVVQEPLYDYPVNFVGLWEEGPEIVRTKDADGEVTTVIGRFYLWQKLDEKGGLVEFRADSAVIFHGDEKIELDQLGKEEGSFAASTVGAVYFRGNIVMSEGDRTIRADEMYYDFENRQALAVRAEMRTFDARRGLPIYLRAAKLRQVSDEVFEAEDITLTTSEFYLPQISLTATRMVLTDTTALDARSEKAPDKNSYEGVLEDIKLKLENMTVFGWPKFRTNFERPDVPIRKIRIGHDSDFGTSVETQWFLARLLGRKEPAGVDSTMLVDYYSKRGMGAGVDVEYKRESYFGDIIGYIIDDRGEDDLGRTASRKNLRPDNELRGRFGYRHRQWLPYDWQLMTELNYISDEHFMESFYRNEFNVGKPKETLVHLKRLQDNWGFSFLSKFRINDWETMTEELPTVEFHLTGASFWDDRLTYYTDTQVSRFRDRRGDDPTDGGFYSFGFTRHEVDMPFMWQTMKIVPFAAGTYGYEDQDGFDLTLDDVRTGREDKPFLGEWGFRASTMFWKEDQFLRSSFWDLNGLRHIIKPHVEFVGYNSNDSSIDMRDVLNFGISQRWQTRRGVDENARHVDWMRLNVDATWMKDESDSTMGPAYSYGPGRFIWNDPSTPFLVRRDNIWYGMVRDSLSADYICRISDTMTFFSDMNYDTTGGVVQQFNVGVSRFVYPDISYYIGNRYLRPVIVAEDDVYEVGSNSFITALTWALNARYTIAFSQEYNFDYGRSVRSDLTLIRRYHRLYYGLTFSTDESLDRQSIMLSVWPQGVQELALGDRRYMGLTGQIIED
jgi:hypothetical protein